ncbi:tautomerase family protein [Acetobacteraceae bacterium KSS8]|uniref:Tautomerase family protein n=1 Tax=Endosaccharibacter trunci TaxID=2812733 RepID=A0ABT1W4R4_9PROT|nr:tautomerase family protein [Acetobacteraceae bacterium KSS8]
MPLVRFSLLRGKSADHLRAIGDGIQQALVEQFGVPPDDRFQLVHQHERDEFLYDPAYLGVERSDDLVMIDITASNWRSVAQKKALYRAIADNLARNPGLRPEDVLIVLSPNERADWSFGRGLASYVPDDAAT